MRPDSPCRAERFHLRQPSGLFSNRGGLNDCSERFAVRYRGAGRRHAVVAAAMISISGVRAVLASRPARRGPLTGLPQSLAPYAPTPEDVVDRMLALAGTTQEDVVYDLGCGDGRIPIAAAKTYGARGVGVDIDPTADRGSQRQRQSGRRRAPGRVPARGRAAGRRLARDRRHALPALVRQRQAAPDPDAAAPARRANRVARVQHGSRRGRPTRSIGSSARAATR